jgi:hypothetical protein
LAPLLSRRPDDRSPRRRWTDRIVGILAGLALGLGVLVYFVFVHSEGTIDAPKIDEGGKAAAGETTLPAHPGSPEQPAEEEPAGESGGAAAPQSEPTPKSEPVPVVPVVGGAPPTGAGPKQLRFRKGERVRFEIKTSEPFSFEIRGLDITESIEHTATISFKATKTGQFPVIASATLIGVADLMITPRK